MNARGVSVSGEYNRDGYTVLVNDEPVYAAGNHKLESTSHATRPENRLNLRTLRQFCALTCRLIAGERNGAFAGVERVAEEEL